MSREILKLRIGRKTGLHGDGPAKACIFVESYQKVSTTHPFEGENSAILPALLRRALDQVFMNLNEAVDRIFQPEAVWIRAVITIKDGWITLRSKDIGIRKQLVPHDGAADASAIGIVVLHESHCSLRVDTRKPGMIQR